MFGFNPTKDPELMRMQEERYRECEEEKQKQQIISVLKTTGIVVLITGIIILYIYEARRRLKDLEEGIIKIVENKIDRVISNSNISASLYPFFL